MTEPIADRDNIGREEAGANDPRIGGACERQDKKKQEANEAGAAHTQEMQKGKAGVSVCHN